MAEASQQLVSQPVLKMFPEKLKSTNEVMPSWKVRGQNFSVTWIRTAGAGGSHSFTSSDEIMVIVLDANAKLSCAKHQVDAPPRSVCILPGGLDWRIEPTQGATCAVIVSLREDAAQRDASNEQDYQLRDTRIRSVGVPYAVKAGEGVRVIPIDTISAPADKPRLKMLQTSTLSINWVEYQGPRDRQALSPHAHTDFEQGSLGLIGDFSHHLRVPWGENANLWHDDQHAQLASPSLMVVPVNMIHTSEGVGSGHHLLIDIFSPPRADFIAKGWVANSSDYLAPPKS